MKTPGSLKPGKEGDRFVKMQPAKNSKYIGIASKDKEINLDRWRDLVSQTAIARHCDRCHSPLHGGKFLCCRELDCYMSDESPNNWLTAFPGAYVIGDGRQDDCGFAAKTLLQHTSATHVFCPQYACLNPGGRFPAQLQDAVTCFYT